MKRNILNSTLIVSLCLVLFSCSQEEIDETTSKVTYSPELITLESGVVVEKQGDNYLWEGDILLSPTQLKALNDSGTIFIEATKNPTPITSLNPVTNLPGNLSSENGEQTKALGIYPTAYNLWAMVRFTYNANLTPTQKSRIKTALLDIESRTNIRFYNATGQPIVDPTYGFAYPYVDFKAIGNEDTSQSYIGRIGGRQEISLADFAFYYYSTGVIEHEILHACGMLHEQCRKDRDNYVTINSSNLTSKGKSQFTKRTTNYHMIGSYDFNSIMGYSSMTSSRSVVVSTSEPMYTKKDGSHIHQGSIPSDLDRRWVNSLYLPYIARSDVYRELDAVVYKSDNTVMTASERLSLQAQLNNGVSTPPAGGRISNEF
ncbi:M12 family metallopeptidase [Labilibaculum sp. K2S]|uniref:M12 family metallopeptidase n=1 Tax=Labilibaculum sp. K2S TaxID=3056386 RepID=UPI0025A325A2|nr:M12 family metallopeptidase [Labilibaculum sp. K2S]MDM8159369.1 M12 family metallopeptidase [Labilibaculum sp. K2S]